MANGNETTFRDLQMDERYKKLERTLKMVLLKNSERGIMDNGNSGTWPSISSINGDNLDTSCAAMSIQSSRIGSEVLTSSTNLRNMMSHRKQSFPACNNLATSSENQYPINRDNDSAMMPPPQFPGPLSARCKRSGEQISRRAPLLNMPINLDRNDHGFTRSTPMSSSISSVSKCPGSIDGNSSIQAFSQQIDYRYRNTYKETDDNARSAKAAERSFSRWRVMLNDKAQLIIKGTLECGKVARSKPVIRRLTASSVQSIFKHTYHLEGNLIDERNELPDYVRGKFFNGFPDDWENVYQVWRNYVSDGSKLSFRWPTPITDSDDDIKSEMTDISYHPRYERHNKSKSPRKRRRHSRPSSSHSTSIAIDENQFEKNQWNSSQAMISKANISLENSIKSSGSLTKNQSRSIHSNDSGVGNAMNERNKLLLDASVTSLDSNQRVIGNSLKDIIQEDKLNIIIDNLTNKNCSMEYIQKIVEMFDCMKYVVSYRSTESNDPEKCNAIKNLRESIHTPSTEKSTMKESSHHKDTSQRSIENRSEVNSACSASKRSNITETMHKDHYSNSVRRKLSKEDYDSTESENDYYEERGRRLVNSRSEKSQKFADYKVSTSSARTIQRYQNFDRGLVESHDSEKDNEARVSKENKRHDSSLSEEEFAMETRSKLKDLKKDKVLPSKKHPQNLEKPFCLPDSRDSSISITEDETEERYDKEHRMKKTPRINYDSSVSITEDEHRDIRIDKRMFEASRYHSEKNLRSVDQNVTNIDDARNERRHNLQNVEEIKSCSVEPGFEQNVSDHKFSRKVSTIKRPAAMENHRGRIDNAMMNIQEDNDESNDFSPEHQEDSAYMSSEIKRRKIPESGRAILTESKESYADSYLKDIELERNVESRLMTPAKMRMHQLKKKPVVVSCEVVNFDIRRDGPSPIIEKENSMNASNDRLESNRSSNDPKNNSTSQKSTTNVSLERTKNSDITTTKSAKKETNVKTKDTSNEIGEETNTENAKATSNAEKPSVAQYGSEKNPKQLTAWVPAVICEDDNDAKCRLIFEGKLLNEAGHVVNRKFTTDFVKRRVNAKLIETIDRVFYQLIGDLNATKHVVPKDLVKLCHSGCPSKINNFCERWKLCSGNMQTPTKEPSHATSIESLSVPTSSRGRRILPPLNYWTGERIVMKDNTAVYNPGNCEELSISSSLEKTNEEIPKKRQREKRGESAANGAKKKEAEKISPSGGNKTSTNKSPSGHGSQRLRSVTKRSTRKVQESSTESDEEETKTKIVIRKRKMKPNESALKTDATSARKLRQSSKGTTLHQNLGQSTSLRSNSFEKPSESDVKAKLRKRQKIDIDDGQFVVAGTSKQLTSRGSSEVTCTLYKNVPLHDGDLSDDQLSTI